MRKISYLVISIFIIGILSSCGKNGETTSEVKLFPVISGGEYQYIDREGKIEINPQFSYASVFRDGLALVKTTGDEPKYGFITEDGKFSINAQYNEATAFNDGLAWVVAENAAPAAIDKEGEIKFTLQDAEEVRLFKNGLAAFSKTNEEGDKKWGFVDKTGQVVINPQFYDVSNFSDGKCWVKNDEGKYGFIDKKGKIVINYQFDAAGDFENGKCAVEFGNKVGIIDEEGKYIINPQFSAMEVDGDLFRIVQDGKHGWCDKDGKIIINPQFGDAYRFNGNKITAVKSGKSYGYIDKDGKLTVNPQFDHALPFNGKLALVVVNRKVGFIDETGKYIVNPQFENASPDLVQYILTGGQYNSTAKSDYFNVDIIASIVNVNSPEGFSFNSTFGDVMKKYELEKSDFGKYSSHHQVLSSKKISNDASYDFIVNGSAHDQITVTKGNGWYTYNETEYRFNEKKSPTSYIYNISLEEKGRGKQDVVINAIIGKLSGYKKNETKSVGSDLNYSDGRQEITIQDVGNGVIIIIEQVEVEEAVTEEVAVDSTAVE